MDGLGVTLEIFLNLLSWAGNGFAVLASFMIGGGNMRGWWAYLVADVLIIGTQIYYHVWSGVALFVIFILLSIRGIVKAGLLK